MPQKHGIIRPSDPLSMSTFLHSLPPQYAFPTCSRCSACSMLDTAQLCSRSCCSRARCCRKLLASAGACTSTRGNGGRVRSVNRTTSTRHQHTWRHTRYHASVHMSVLCMPLKYIRHPALKKPIEHAPRLPQSHYRPGDARGCLAYMTPGIPSNGDGTLLDSPACPHNTTSRGSRQLRDSACQLMPPYRQLGM